MNESNLIPNSERSPEEVRENGRKGGIASGKARREKRNMQETLKLLLNLTMNDGEATKPEDIKSLADVKGANLTVDQAILLAQIKKAIKGDTQSASFIRDTSGNNPTNKVEHSGSVPVVIKDDITE